MLKDIATNVDPNFYDETLSETSINAVQNKVITQALNKKVDKTELSKKQDVISDLSEIRNKANSALQSVPSEYVTESELANKGYLTEHQDISGLATKEEVANAIAEIPSIEGLATEQFVTDEIAKIEIPTLDGYATEAWVGEQGFLTEHQDISGKQDKIADLAQIRANAQKGATALQSVPSEYATKTDVSAAGEQKANKSELIIKKSKGTSSAIQEVEVETFVDETPDSPTNGQEIPTEASGNHSVVLNGKSNAGAKRALAHGNRTIALGENSHTEGHCTQVINLDEVANGYAAHAEGYGTVAAGTYSHAEGNKTVTIGANSHSEGADTLALGEASHVEGYFAYTGESSSAPIRPTIEDTPSGGESGGSGTTTTTKKGTAAHAEGNYTIAEGSYSHAEGRQCDSIGEGSHAEGTETITYADYSHTEGNKTKTHTNGVYSHAEGIGTYTDAAGAHAEGFETHANNECSHAEGHGAVASGIYAHAEGWVSNAIGEASHAEGQNTRAHQIGSHSEGNNTDAQGPYSHAEGIGTKTKEGIAGQHVEGYYNQESDSVKIIGCGTSDNDRKNAVEVTQDGRVFVKGVGNYDGTSLEAKDLATVINEGGQGGGSDDYLSREEFEERIEGYATHDSVQELSENVTELSAEVSGLSEGIALRNVGAEDTDESVEEPEIPAPTPSVSNEWKCVYDGRMEVGTNKIECSTYADGTPLNAKEVIVQTLCDTSSQKEVNGYAVIQSTNNKTRSLYGAIQFERNAASSQNQILDQIHFKASPIMYMVAEICRGVKCAVASPADMQVQGGSVPFQIYEDIVSIELAPNEKLTSAAPYLKIYAR